MGCGGAPAAEFLPQAVVRSGHQRQRSGAADPTAELERGGRAVYGRERARGGSSRRGAGGVPSTGGGGVGPLVAKLRHGGFGGRGAGKESSSMAAVPKYLMS
ncbi:hypothetical protein E2562_038788 [Oryza meyeriana var. granulata]|uniref:Uncharacterized protein n=1 Tax=Oryza meyeriana var. granulata TaxID=110450 RepID=A0A6G1C1T1_9ORYZ|nr:hypothetical protein E2562_038788 [Oryza meyeriana var. granulata]